MLDASRAPQLLAGLVLFADHADANLRYVLPPAPTLVADPTPRIALLHFRGGSGGAGRGPGASAPTAEAAGALLQLEASLAPRPEALAAAEAALIAAGVSAPRLVPPDWRAGRLRLEGWLAEAPSTLAAPLSPLAPRSLYVGEPSRLGHPMAVIAARLDPAGAALADAALRGNALPTALIFELEMLALAGPLAVSVEADLAALHERLTAEGALTTPYGRARLAKTWESAARDNLVRVRLHDETSDVEAQRAEAMRRVGEDLVARLFSPVPPAEAPPLLDNGSVAPIELSFRLTARRESLQTTQRWDFRERSVVSVHHHAAASLVDLLGTTPAAAVIRFAELEAPVQRLRVAVEPELGAIGLVAVEVDLAVVGDAGFDAGTGEVAGEVAGGSAGAGAGAEAGTSATSGSSPAAAGAPQLFETLLLDDATPQRDLLLRPERAAQPLAWRARSRFDPDATAAADRVSAWQPLDPAAQGLLVVVSPRRLFAPRRFEAIAGRIEFDWLDHAALQVEAPGERARTLVLRADAPQAAAFLPGAGEAPIAVSIQWRGRDGEPSWREPARTRVASGQAGLSGRPSAPGPSDTSSVADAPAAAGPGDAADGLLVVDSPFAPSLSLWLLPLPLAGVASISVELEGEDPALSQRKLVTWDDGARDPRRVALRRLDPSHGYRHRLHLVHDDGRVETRAWQRSDATTLVLGLEGPARVSRTEVQLLGGGPAGRGSLAVELLLQSGDETSRALLEGEADHATLLLATALQAPRPLLRAREFLADGQVQETRWDDPPELVVLPALQQPVATPVVPADR